MGESIVDEILQTGNMQRVDSIYLHRIQIPNFQALKEIDIVFELDLIPSIFPLGSLNGGGKSTLLQIIFTLLYSCGEDSEPSFLANMLNGFPIDSPFAIIDCIVQSDLVKLEFTTCSRVEKTQQEEMFWRVNANNKAIEKSMMRRMTLDDYGYSFNLCEYTSSNSRIGSLNCQLSGIQREDRNLANRILNLISNSVFLAAPITQSFRFIDQNTKALAFRNRSIGEYYQLIDDIRDKLTSFFTYDIVAVDILIKVFEKARNHDSNFITSNSGYGNSYQEMLKDIEEMLGDKKVSIDKDLQGVSFLKKNMDGDMLRLYPEDLSHGELKRLSLFIWLKYNKIENSIVLIDEIEIALHPDWQYQIVRDLEAWAPSNQYILATHSYELCRALTPAHVKEIPPQLFK
jgi:predicted ATP-dependent endonuclease of OLD family